MEMLTEKPSIVVVSCSNIKPKSLIKLITNSTNVSEDSEGFKVWHPWTINTKYYSADVVLYGISDQFPRTEEFNAMVEALIILMDSNKETGLDDLEIWSGLESDCDPEIKLLVCNYCTDITKITKAKATEWCLKRGFELIELYPSIKQSSEPEDSEIIKEKMGVHRIIEAVQTHVWPNLVMKNRDGDNKDNEVQADTSTSKINGSDKGLNIPKLNEFLTDEGADDFAKLFSQITMMKDAIESMPRSQRKQCAEQTVTAFWQAIGGDEEELSEI